mmetsp:Transcript_49109/g.114873  ORF Transcript_49109/g.114873 Transcript_49109/m.114873 type:complete len:172 (-) Transcript_49109:66-581(-)
MAAPVLKIRTQSVPVKVHHTNQVHFAFGHKVEDEIWQHGIGGGYHEPIRRGEHSSSLFKTWSEQWSDPANALPGHARFAARRSGGGRVLPPSKAELLRETFSEFGRSTPDLHSVSPLPLGQLTSDRDSFRGSELRTLIPPKTLCYPNPSNWKRSTSLPTRPPGYVGKHITR